MRERVALFFRVAFLSALLLGVGCTAYNPKSIDDVPFRERAESQRQGKVTVSTAALNSEEAERLFQLPLGKQEVQPVWIEVDNREDVDYFLLPLAVDPEYFSPAEIAYRGGAERRAGILEELRAVAAQPADG